MDNGTVRLGDTIITLDQQAYIDNRCNTVAYYATGHDTEGNEYRIRWDVISDCEDGDESGACDWDNPIEIAKI